MRALVFPLVAVVAALLTGCTSAAPTSTPTPTATVTAVAEPTTLEELGTAVVVAGQVDSANIYLTDGAPRALTIQLLWTRTVTPSEQLAVLTEVSNRVDDVIDDRPDLTRLGLIAPRDDDERGVVVSTYDPGAEVILEMLETVDDSPCHSASLDNENRGEGVRAQVTLECEVAASDAVGLAAGYDEITSHRFDAVGINATEWEVSIAGQGTTNANLRLDVGPIEGRQKLFMEVMTLALAAGADRFTLIDSGSSVSLYGFADPAQTDLCATIADRITAAGVERAAVSMQMRDITPGDWTCRVSP